MRRDNEQLAAVVCRLRMHGWVGRETAENRRYDLGMAMDVLAKLEKVQTGAMDKPTTPVVMEKVWVTTR